VAVASRHQKNGPWTRQIPSCPERAAGPLFTAEGADGGRSAAEKPAPAAAGAIPASKETATDAQTAEIASTTVIGGTSGAAVTATLATGQDISIETAVEPGQHIVNMHLTITNKTTFKLEKMTLKLVYDANALALKTVPAEFTQTGDDIALGTIEPSSTLKLAIGFEPLQLAVSDIEGLLIFKSRHGKLETLLVPKVTVTIERPQLFTESNISTAKLMKHVSEELEYSGAKIFTMPAEVRPQMAFEIGKAAVQRHDFRLVNQFAEKEPYIAEAWFYGQAKGTADKLVVRVRFIGEKSALEFFVLGTSSGLMTSMALSLKKDLVSEMISNEVRPGIKEVTEPDEAKSITSMRTLLDKELGAENAIEK